ncbi:enoyl-CoA hydratase/isomerase [Plectosphaerella cucumerina]|uniref:3-hydroxyisobutyryl-CoA hydrolase n=1 Tax=Plectosphaerella cucumerina TaxID=40658 RepID=A0A8K0X7H8_9PEZI|nr:enoyl-CoA hydratase/isomerase [Plectosphaerella cucumerina]
MPLRAKITGAGAAQMSTDAPTRESKRPQGEPDDVVFKSLYGLRSIELNRPKKLNSLNASMIRKILPRMRQWEKSDMANVILIKGAGDKAFCAGGDVTALAKNNKESPDGWKESSDYFALEYKLNHYIATYEKPYVALMDGITMGGGVGLSVHAPFRIATERTVFAMPETTIGFFPDVGASFFLPRMNGYIGTYLALTSERLKGVNAFYSGIATHYLHSTSLPALESRLAELRFNDYDNMNQRLAIIQATLEECSTGLPHDEHLLLGGKLRKAIDRCFSKDNIVEIIAALKAETGATQQWAEKTIDTLHKRSPTAVNVALRQMRIGRGWSIAETFRREHQIATHFMKHPDFVEGVSALLMSKENPRAPVWQPATLEEITNPGEIVEPFFAEDPSVEPLQLISNRDFKEYPYGDLGVPTEQDVYRTVRNQMFTKGEAIAHICESRGNRQGVADVVEEIFKRKVVVDSETRKAKWADDSEFLQLDRQLDSSSTSE